MQTANILGLLIEKTGLRVPVSYLYKKFSIPEPEGSEEIAAPRPANTGMGAMAFKETPPAILTGLKNEAAPFGTQEHIDSLANAALRHSADGFEKMFSPILKLLDHADSLEQLRDLMESEKEAAALFSAMPDADLEALLQKAMVYANLAGRLIENED